MALNAARLCHREAQQSLRCRLGATQLEAFEMALASDPESAFGSIICFNEVVEEATAEAVGDLFVEVMMAPGYTDQAKTVLMAKKTGDCSPLIRRATALNHSNGRSFENPSKAVCWSKPKNPHHRLEQSHHGHQD